MLTTFLNLILSIFRFFESLSPERKEQIINMFLELYDSVFRAMYKNKTNEQKGNQ